MKITEKKVVSLAYELNVDTVADEFEIVEVVGEDNPMVFLVGHSGLPVDFENKLEGLEENDSFDFELLPQEGFGEFSEDDVAEFPLEMFKIEDGKIPADLLEIGNFVPFTNDDGSQITGRVHEVNEEIVLIDFNHPLAGKTLRFQGTVLKVREATADELAHGHVHGEGGIIH